MSKLLETMIKAATKGGKKPNYGKMKTDLSKKVREGTATKAEKSALKELGKKDVRATLQQKARQSASSRNKAVSLAGSPKVGGTVKRNAGGPASAAMAKMAENKKEREQAARLGPKVIKKGGPVKPKGVGCAQRGYGGAMTKKGK